MLITYTANTGYFISQITINGSEVTIQKSLAYASNYETITSVCEYKCYRTEQNQVIVVLKSVVATTTVIGSARAEPVTVLNSGGAGSFTFTTDFDVDTGDTTLILTPASGYFVYSVALDSNEAQLIDSYGDRIYQECDAFAVNYVASDYSNKVKFYFDEISASGAIQMNIVLTTTKPTLNKSGGTQITGISAVSINITNGEGIDTCLAGYVKMSGYNNTNAITSIPFSAVANKGFQFVNWTVDGEELSTADAVYLPISKIEGKLVVANFKIVDDSILNDVLNNV